MVLNGYIVTSMPSRDKQNYVVINAKQPPKRELLVLTKLYTDWDNWFRYNNVERTL